MATLPYRQNQPGLLQELLPQATEEGAPGMVPTPPQPPQIVSEGTFTPQERQRLIDVLLQPEDPGPEPEVDKPNALALLFSGLGDAFSGAVGSQPNYTARYVNRLDRQKADLLNYQQRLAETKDKSKRKKAEFLLGQDERARARTETLEDRETARKERIAWEGVQAQNRMDEFKAREAQDLTQQKAQFDFQREMQTNQLRANKESDERQLSLYDKKKKGEADDEQHKAVMELRAGVVANKAQTIADLKAGKVTPEQVIEEWNDELDARGLIGEYRSAIDSFFKAKMNPTLMQFAPQQGPSTGQSTIEAAMAANPNLSMRQKEWLAAQPGRRSEASSK